MKTFYITLSLVLLSQFLHAQNQVNNWFFGQHEGITFNTNPPSMISGGQTNTNEGCSSISDDNGNLLFYSDGVYVWNSSHSIMQNGTGLLGSTTSTQSALIVPAPGSTTLYYLITAPASLSNPLAYSIIDMTLNNGLGAVTLKNVSLLLPSSEKLTATHHQNGSDIWIIAHQTGNNNFSVFQLTSAGINPIPVVSSAGNTMISNIGYLKASPCGNQLAMTTWVNTNALSTLELFDFDNSTGVVSNSLLLGQWTVYNGAYGVEFSPDNSKLYTSFISPGLVFQYDLLAGSPSAIIASIDTIANVPQNNSGNGALQLGPDGSIYQSKGNDSTIACITNPNQPGNAVNYVVNYLTYLSSTGALGLPNFLSSYFCNIPSGTNSVSPVNNISVYPNPFNNSISIEIEKQNIKQVTITIRNVIGQTVFFENENNINDNSTKSIDLNFLKKGIYFIELILDDDRVVKKIIKE